MIIVREQNFLQRRYKYVKRYNPSKHDQKLHYLFLSVYPGKKVTFGQQNQPEKGWMIFSLFFFLRFYFFWKFRFSNLYSHVGKGEITSADSRNNTDIKIFLWFKKFKHFDSWITWNPGQEQFWKYYLWRSLSFDRKLELRFC